MKRKIIFVVSLFVILLCSWANADIFGTSHIRIFSEPVKQLIHFVFLAITAAIGYYNLKDNEKWMRGLWLAIYILAFFVVAASGLAVYFISGSSALPQIKTVITGIRNGFTGPLPFLVFYLFITLTGRIIAVTRNQKDQ